MTNTKRVYANLSPWNRYVEFLLVQKIDGERYIAKPVEMKQVSGENVEDPTFRLGMDEAQELIDQLWNCGLRPSEGSGSAGSLAATQKHLEDMRKIAFDFIGRTA